MERISPRISLFRTLHRGVDNRHKAGHDVLDLNSAPEKCDALKSPQDNHMNTKGSRTFLLPLREKVARRKRDG
jgi:hypothetical protein